MGYSGTGTFTQLSATNSASYLYLGANSGSSGAYSLGGGGQLSASVEYVGSSGTGTFTQLSATNSASYLYLGANSGSSGAYSLGGSGQLSASVEYVGSSGTGSLIQSGGANNVALLYLGDDFGGNGAYSLSGSGQLSAASEFLAATAGATATFQQTGGTNAASLVLIGSGGSYLLGGGLLQVNSNLLNQGVFSGGERGGSAQRQRHSRSFRRHTAEPGQHLGLDCR